MQIRNRIVEMRRVRASELVPHPDNWRKHPQHQIDALRSSFESIGFVGAEIVRVLEDGRLQTLDGHARAKLADDSEVPVLVTDLDEDEAKEFLATFDPIGNMAEADRGLLSELIGKIDTESGPIENLLSRISQDNGIVPPEFNAVELGEQSRLDEKTKTKCPECGHEF